MQIFIKKLLHAFFPDTAIWQFSKFLYFRLAFLGKYLFFPLRSNNLKYVHAIMTNCYFFPFILQQRTSCFFLQSMLY